MVLKYENSTHTHTHTCSQTNVNILFMYKDFYIFIENVPTILINLVNVLNNNVFLLIFVVFSSDER